MVRLRGCQRLLGALVCTLAAAIVAEAQTVRGEVYDSLLARGPMVGARVALEGLPQSAVTDRRGRFVLSDVPEGTYLLSFHHPALDSARVGAPVYRVTVPPSGLRDLELATPSFATTSRFLCGATLDSASMIVLGRARAAEDGRSLAGATARVSWWEMSFGDGGGVRNVDRTMTVEADSVGEFRLCGVPSDVDLAMTVQVGSHQSGELAFPERGRAIIIRDVFVSLTDSATAVAADSAGSAEPLPVRPGAARLRVRVVDERGRALENATVGIRGHEASATSDADGLVRLASVPAGSQTVVVRAIGRAPRTEVIALTPDQETIFEARMDAVGNVLPEFRVTGLQMDSFRAAYERRRTSGSGTFLDNDDLNQIGRRAADLSVLAGVQAPMTSLEGSYSNRPLIYFRSSGGGLCLPTIFVDGVPRLRMDGWELHQILQMATKVEIYRRGISIPSEFANSGSGCGVLVIWTMPF